MNKKISLVLSGGGARGIAHIGVIEEIVKQGFEIHSIAGTSMGALVGGMYSVGKMSEFKDWLISLDKFEVFKLVDFTLSKHGLIKGNRVFSKIKEFIPDMNIEDLKIKYTATATDLINKKEIVFTKGSIYEAIRASIAIPTVFTPVKKNNTILVDGGVINNVPINHAERIDKDILIVSYVNADTPVYRPNAFLKGKKKQTIYLKKVKEFQNKLNKYHSKNKTDNLGYFDILNKTVNIMTNKLSMISIETYKPDVLVNISRESSGVFDFYRAEELIEIGRYMTTESLKKYKNNLIKV